MASIASIIHSHLGVFIPRALVDVGVALLRPISGFWGKYKDWHTASALCCGWDSERIVNSYRRYLTSTIQGEDFKEQLSSRRIRLLAALSVATSKVNDGSISILDYGGGWGGHYFDLSQFLPNLSGWYVIEHESIAHTMSITEDLPDSLNFVSDAKLIPVLNGNHSIVLASGVLQCLEEGLLLLGTTFLRGEFLILDRVPLISRDQSYITIQRTSRLLGGIGSSYPVWLFSRSEFFRELKKHWQIELSWFVPEDSPSVRGVRRPYEGFLLKRLHS